MFKDSGLLRMEYVVPAHIEACATACRNDLLFGPSFVRIPWGNLENFTEDDFATLYEDVADECDDVCGDVVEETYTGRVGNALRAFIDDLPSEVWIETDSGIVQEYEPDQFEENPDYDPEDEYSGPEMYERDMSGIWHINQRDIIEALFGTIIAKEFR
jgi:hypothetical protein